MDSQDEETGSSFVVCEEIEAFTGYFIYACWAISCVVLVLSLVLILGLLIPLLIQLKDGALAQRRGSDSTMPQRRRSDSNSTPQRRRSDSNSTPQRRRSDSNRGVYRVSFSQMRPRKSTYSTYNLYLVYLAFVDLVFVLLTLSAQMMALNQNYNPNFYSSRAVIVFMDPPPPAFETDNVGGKQPSLSLYLDASYAAANMWINTIIVYELFILLRATHGAQRINQPSLRRVNLQGGGVIFGSILLGLLFYYQSDLMIPPWENWWSPLILILTATITSSVPVVYVLGVSIFVKWRGYMPAVNGSTPMARAVRGLVFYFLRITFVFIVVWLPYVVVGILFALGDGAFCDDMVIARYLTYVLMIIQPIMTFCLALTKPDVKNYIKDLVTLKYIYSWERNNNKALPLGGDEGTNRVVSAPANIVSIFGYSFPDASDDADDDAGDDDNVEVVDNSVGGEGTKETSVSNHTIMNDALASSSSVEIVFPSTCTNSEVQSHSINITHPTISEGGV